MLNVLLIQTALSVLQIFSVFKVMELVDVEEERKELLIFLLIKPALVKMDIICIKTIVKNAKRLCLIV